MTVPAANSVPFRNAYLAVLAVVMAIPQTVSAQTARTGLCTIATDAPPAVEAALDRVLMQGIGAEIDSVPEEITLLFSPVGAAPGAVVSVRGPGWRYIKSAGMADPDAGSPVDCRAPFQIGSNTKMMTAAMILQLHEEGRLSIDDPLWRHLPEIAGRLPNGDAITLRQLAQHTAGVFSYTDNAPDGTAGLMESGATDRDALRRPLDPQEAIEFVIAHGQPLFAPGETGKWSYSNTGSFLLGMVIERLDGQAIDKSLQERISSRRSGWITPTCGTPCPGRTSACRDHGWRRPLTMRRPTGTSRRAGPQAP